MVTARTSSPVDDRVAVLREYLEADRAARGHRRRANERFRQARLMLGAQLLLARRGLSNHAFGAVLRELRINRHTAYHAMRLAGEFSRPDGSLDVEKVAAARDRHAGLLRTTVAGQRVLAADPLRLSVKDLGRLARAEGKHQHRQGTEQTVAPDQQRAEGSPRSLPGGRGAGGADQAPAAAAPAASQTGGGPGEKSPGRPLVIGAQLTLDFGARVGGLTRRLERVADRLRLGADMDTERLGELVGLVDRADTIALSLLQGGPAGTPAAPVG